MPSMESLGKFLLLTGIFLAVLGLLLVFSQKIPFLGRLPGDISIQGEKFKFFFPLATSLILSLLLTIVVNIIVRLLGRQ